MDGQSATFITLPNGAVQDTAISSLITPEPASFLLMAGGALALMLRRRLA